MAMPHIPARRIAPYLLSGASGIHVLIRMWQLNNQSEHARPVHVFLLKHTDVVLVLTGVPIVWHLAQRHEPHTADTMQNTQDQIGQRVLLGVAHQLRQVFTSLLLGLGLIERKATKHQSYAIPSLVQRLRRVVAEGIQAVNIIDPPDSGGRNGAEEEFEV